LPPLAISLRSGGFIVLTGIGNEPDDSESMLSFLPYSNEFEVDGLLAVTST
jgi:hypothetical protein